METCFRNRSHKLDIYTAPTKARSRKPTYLRALIQNRIDRQRVRSRESGRQIGRQSDGYAGWCWDGKGNRKGRTNPEWTCWRAVF